MIRLVHIKSNTKDFSENEVLMEKTKKEIEKEEAAFRCSGRENDGTTKKRIEPEPSGKLRLVNMTVIVR